MTGLPAAVSAALVDLPGSDGWWHPDDREEYERLADELLVAGLPEATVIDVLTRAYAAAANEFGA